MVYLKKRERVPKRDLLIAPNSRTEYRYNVLVSNGAESSLLRDA